MSISCQYCRQKIEKNSEMKSFVFSLGNIVNGQFIEKETLYYHMECLSNDKLGKNKNVVAYSNCNSNYILLIYK